MSLVQRLKDIFMPSLADPVVARLYSICVVQARQPVFYQKFAVPDTVDGRFDMLLLHVWLVMRCLGRHPQVKQQLFDLMFADMDRSLREMGVGDMSISKKMRPMIQAFYGRAQAYEKALGGNGDALTDVLQRNLYGSVEVDTDVQKLMTGYVLGVVAKLEQQNADDIVAGKVTFGSVE
jgi:cytochrome b pre-mRNA-processing protein 3